MAYLSRKRIKGNDYLYAVRSFRLPDGKAAKISKRVADAKEAEGLDGLFDKRQSEALAAHMKKSYSPLKLRDEKALEKIELMSIEYRRILSKLSQNQAKDLFDRFTTNFTYESNALEGNSLTLKEVAIVIHENRSIPGKDLREIYETKNSRRVVDMILKKRFRIREQDVLKMHSMLVQNMDIPQGYKKFPNYLHGRQLVTTPPEKVPEAMKGLFSWFEKNRQTTHPLKLAAGFHGRFEQIHPFEDSNGRVGRFLVNAVLANANYPPLIIRKTQRLSYFNALSDFDNGRTATLGEFLYHRFCETNDKFFKIYIKYL